MARNIAQSTQGLSAAARSLCKTRWGTDLEERLAKLKQPALFQALHVAIDCREGETPLISEILDNARANPHQFTEASFPLDMPVVYDAYERYEVDVFKREKGNPALAPTLSRYLGWLVLSKIWRLCDSVTTSATQVFEPVTVIEIAGICLLAEHAQRILHSEERVNAASPYWILAKFGKVDRRSKAYKRKCRNFWKKAEGTLLDRYRADIGMYPSLEAAAMGISETEVLPFNFLECFQMLQSVEEQT